MIYIEDYLQHICETHLNSLEPSSSIYFSIYKQVTKGVGLTDRQYNLVLSKIQEFVDVADLPVQIPLREIDRSKYVKLVNHVDVIESDAVYESHKSNWQWIKIRFPFTKKLIVLIEDLVTQNRKYYHHQKGSHEHYFRVKPKLALKIYEAFKDKSFDIDDTLIEYVNKVYKIQEQKNNVIPSFQNGNVINLLNNVNHALQNDIGTNTDSALLKDRSRLYGYNFEMQPNKSTLIEIIACRDNVEFLAKPDEWNINQIVQAVYELDRWPIVVPVDESNAFDQVLQVYKAFNGIIDSSEQSVLFRADSSDRNNSGINNFIKENKLNNWVDNTTKIVYIKKNKLPKVLISSGFKPKTALYPTSLRSNNHVNIWIKFNCDLVLYHDDSFSSFSLFKGHNNW